MLSNGGNGSSTTCYVNGNHHQFSSQSNGHPQSTTVVVGSITNGANNSIKYKTMSSPRTSIASRSSYASSSQLPSQTNSLTNSMPTTSSSPPASMTNGGGTYSPRSSITTLNRASPRSQLTPTPIQQNGMNGNHNGSSDDGLVVIRMRPDSQGRFGFNVKVCR